jgi:hypothetical protein
MSVKSTEEAQAIQVMRLLTLIEKGAFFKVWWLDATLLYLFVFYRLRHTDFSNISHNR